jgi:hypothetical protein
MSMPLWPSVTRRAALRGGGFSAATALLSATPRTRASAAAPGAPAHSLEPAPGTALLLGTGQPHTSVLAYNQNVPASGGVKA